MKRSRVLRSQEVLGELERPEHDRQLRSLGCVPLKPLGMSATAVDVDPAWSEKLLGGHSRRGQPRPPIEDFMAAAGSLRSNAEDMLRFLAACLQPPAQPPGPALALARSSHTHASASEWAWRCRLQPFITLARTIRDQRAGIQAAIEHGLSNARVEQINTQIRLITRRGFGYHSQ